MLTMDKNMSRISYNWCSAREKGTLYAYASFVCFARIQRNPDERSKISKSYNFQLYHFRYWFQFRLMMRYSHTKTLTASLLLAGYPKAVTASSNVVNRHDTNFNTVSFILETDFFSSEMPKVSSEDFIWIFSSVLFSLFQWSMINLDQ